MKHAIVLRIDHSQIKSSRLHESPLSQKPDVQKASTNLLKKSQEGKNPEQSHTCPDFPDKNMGNPRGELHSGWHDGKRGIYRVWRGSVNRIPWIPQDFGELAI